jgi:arsenate reductase
MPSDAGRRLHLYGIPNCDSCRRALRWLDARGAPHAFHDIRKERLTAKQLGSWLQSADGAQLINRRSTTWRQLTDAQKQAARHSPERLLMAHPTLLKRPVITDGAAILAVGFDPATLEKYA